MSGPTHAGSAAAPAPFDRVASPPRGPVALRELLTGDVVEAAIGLVGCHLVHGGTDVTIVETEAYHEREEACHGYRGNTPRAAKLRRPPGWSYVYLSYGIHRLVNVVVGSQDEASAVLIRGALIAGAAPLPGPGRLGKLLELGPEHDGVDLLAGGALRLEPAGANDDVTGQPLAAGPRIGITKAVDLPWRFALAGSPGVSRPRI